MYRLIASRVSFGRYPYLSAVARGWFWAIPIVATLSILIGLLEGLGVGLLIPLLSTLTQPPDAPIANPVLATLERFAGHSGLHDRLMIVTGTILAVMLLKNMLAAASNMFSAMLYGRIGQDIRVALAARLRDAPYRFFIRTDSARLINILGTESWQAVDAVRALFVRVSSTSVVLVIGLMLVLIDWRLSIFVGVGALLARAVQKAFERRLNAMSDRMTVSNDALANRMLFTVFGARAIRLFQRGDLEHRRFAAASDAVRRDLLAIDRLSGTLWPGLETLHILLFMAVLVTAVLWGVSLPILAAFLVLLNRMQPHLRTLEQAAGTYAATSGQLREVEWLLDPDNSPRRADGDRRFTALSSQIAFDRVTFAYEGAGDRPPALRDVSFEIPQGSAFAFIGRSGAGKSTLINLLTGLLEPTGGRILIDGVPLHELKRDDWLRTIAVAGQDIELFDGTIAENIAFGVPDADMAAIAAAAAAANADFISALPDGLATRIGDRGLALSGGQRQRIGIARALIRKPQILILDEATNAVDRLSETAILDALRLLPAQTTLIVISHRDSTLELCDAGVVLEDGRVIEAGSMERLARYRSGKSAYSPAG